MNKEFTTHKLKVWDSYFPSLLNGTKTFELRRNDRDFKVGDRLILEEIHPVTRDASGRTIQTYITYVLEDETWLQPGYCALGLAQPPQSPNFTPDQIRGLMINSLQTAMQGPKSDFHQACAEIVIFYLPTVAEWDNEPPELYLEDCIKQIRESQAKVGLLNIPFDPKFFYYCLEAWGIASQN